MFPSLKLPATDSEPQQILLFDRILCDVPCSGDGTLRKNINIWTTFNPHNGNSLHPLQLSILQRSVALLKDNGRIVYSTCSFNPIENEAIVGTLIKNSNGKLRIVDCSGMYPDMKRVAGLKHWIVQDKQGHTLLEPNSAIKITESMFPNTEDLGLENCMRFYPHFMNTGGFFVAVIEKVQEPIIEPVSNQKDTLKRELETETEILDSKKQKTETLEPMHPSIEQPYKNNETLQPYKNKRKGAEPEFVNLPQDSQLSKSISSYYGITNFPMEHLFTRATSATGFKMIYHTSSSAAQLLTHKSLKIINAGIQLFKRNEAKW